MREKMLEISRRIRVQAMTSPSMRGQAQEAMLAIADIIDEELKGGEFTRCRHPVHSNPGLVAPCPECGADSDGDGLDDVLSEGFQDELTALLNTHGYDSKLNMPDFEIASMLTSMLITIQFAMKRSGVIREMKENVHGDREA